MVGNHQLHYPFIVGTEPQNLKPQKSILVALSDFSRKLAPPKLPTIRYLIIIIIIHTFQDGIMHSPANGCQ